MSRPTIKHSIATLGVVVISLSPLSVLAATKTSTSTLFKSQSYGFSFITSPICAKNIKVSYEKMNSADNSDLKKARAIYHVYAHRGSIGITPLPDQSVNDWVQTGTYAVMTNLTFNKLKSTFQAQPASTDGPSNFDLHQWKNLKKGYTVVSAVSEIGMSLPANCSITIK